MKKYKNINTKILGHMQPQADSQKEIWVGTGRSVYA